MYTAIKSMQTELLVVSRKVDILLLSQQRVTKTSPLDFRPVTNEEELESSLQTYRYKMKLRAFSFVTTYDRNNVTNC